MLDRELDRGRQLSAGNSVAGNLWDMKKLGWEGQAKTIAKDRTGV